MARIVVTRRLPEPALDRLRAAEECWISAHDRPLERSELLEAVAGADAIVSLLHDRIDHEVVTSAGSQLAVVANVAVGYDNIDVDVCREHGVTVTNTPGVLNEATADLAFALVLAVTRRLGEAERLVRSGQTWSWALDFMLGAGLQKKTLGIIGLGEIGRAMARRAAAFGMSVVYTGRRRAPEEIERELAAVHLPFDVLLASSDIVSVHCPLTPETFHLVDADRLASMKSSAFLINTSRGPVVDEGALVAALRSHAIAGAGLDVYEREPEIHPGLLGLDNVVLLPHLGSATTETRTAMASLAADNAIAVLSGEPALTPVSP